MNLGKTLIAVNRKIFKNNLEIICYNRDKDELQGSNRRYPGRI